MIRSFAVSIPYIPPAHIWSDDEVCAFITRYIAPHISCGSVVCISSKILSLIEGRYVQSDDPGTKERLSRELSSICWQHQEAHPLMCVTSSGVFAYAGIDESNLPSGYLVLPLLDPIASAERWRSSIRAITGYQNIAVIITDSASQPLRLGTVSRAVGWSGIRPLQDYRGVSDLCHQPMRHTRLNRVDAFASMAGLLMGEGDEGKPVVVIEGLDPEMFCDEQAQLSDVVGDIDDDIFLTDTTKSTKND